MLTLFPRSFLFASLLFLPLTLIGCLSTQIATPLPAGMTLVPVAERLQPATPVAVSADGLWLALVRGDGLFLRPFPDGAEVKLSSESPGALVFNPQGTELLAAFGQDDRCRLQRFAVSNATELGEISLPGHCEALLSREGEWLLFVTSLESFRFGGNLRSLLLHWDGLHPPREELLNDTTLDLSTLTAGAALFLTLRPQLSPHGDEILYFRLHDPPAADPYLAVVLRHLEVAAEHPLARIEGLRGVALYLDGGELVAYPTGFKEIRVVDPWTEREVGKYPRSGADLAAPPFGESLWIDNDLLRRDGTVQLHFSRKMEAVAFLPQGRLLLRDQDGLWLLGGLPIEATASSAPDQKLVRRLRQWRAEGLINSSDYAEKVRR